MTTNNKAAPQASRQRVTSAQMRAHCNLKTPMKHIHPLVFLHLLRREIKAGVGFLFYKKMISFRTACKIAKFLRVQND